MDKHRILFVEDEPGMLLTVSDRLRGEGYTVDCCENGLEGWNTARKGGYDIMIIADHGNADNAINEDGSENTAHSLNPVPCIFVSEKNGIELDNGILADVAPTLLNVMGLEVPAEMTGKNLIK